MAPIRERHGNIHSREKDSTHQNNRGNESGAPSDIGIEQLTQSVDDGLSHYLEELYFLTNIHAKDMKECADKLKIHFQHLEIERERRLDNVAADEGSSWSPPTRADPQVVTCWNCKALSATMVWYPCRHLCFCYECDNKISECPICKNIKLSSFMANQSSA